MDSRTPDRAEGQPGVTGKSWIRAALREPLTHFLLAGLAVFGLSLARGDAADPESRTISITVADVEQLAANWAQTWQRPPTQGEIDGLIRDYIKEEIYNREAIRLGLDKDDTVIRRRLRSKMESLATSQAEAAPPSDADLQAWLDRDPGKYAIGARFSFDQIYFQADSPERAAEKARPLRAAADSARNWQALGEAISLPHGMDKAAADAIARDFGDEFAQALQRLKPGSWEGPVASGFGYHLVRLRQVVPGRRARLDEVRQQVENDWRSATIRRREAEAYQALLDGYTIRIEKP